MNSILNPIFKHYADFKGRSSKAEYWPFALLYILITLPLRLIDMFSSSSDDINPLLALLSLPLVVLTIGLFAPYLAASVRRLHDIGKSGWFMLLAIIPLGGFVLLYFMLQDSETGTNKWGPNPTRRLQRSVVPATADNW